MKDDASATRKRFSASQVKTIDGTKYFYVRAGDEHRFIGIWVVVVDGRVFVRPWNDRADGWYRVFRKTNRGAVRVGAKEVAVRAKPVRGAAINAKIDDGYAAKYTTKPNQQYVKGFATDARRATTLELVPV